jgi:hypothetical protein
MVARSSLLLVLLVACGRTDHDELHDAGPGQGTGGTTTSNAGGTSATGGTGSDGAGAGSGSAGAGGGGARSCLYPMPGLSGIEGSDLAADSFQLSPPFAIDVTPGTWGELAATLDLNGDLVSDLIYLDSDATPPRFRLAMSAPPPNVFDFRPTECPALEQLPAGRLFLRDLDADSVPDLVVGTTRGVHAFLNHEAGLVPVLDYEFPTIGLLGSVINVGAVDLDGDERVDLIVGFDVLRQDGEPSIDVGVRSYPQQTDGQFRQGELFWANSSSGLAFNHEPYAGYLAVGRFGSSEIGNAIMVSRNEMRPVGTVGDRTVFDGAAPVPLLVPEVDEQIFQLLSLPTRLGHAYLLAVGGSNLWVLDLSVNPPRLVTREPLAVRGGYSHEIGGGPERPRYFLYDLDHDGDADFLEQQPDGPLFVHANDSNQQFSEARPYEVTVSGGAESPFLTVGPGSGIVAHPDPSDPRQAVYTLMSTYPPPN